MAIVGSMVPPGEALVIHVSSDAAGNAYPGWGAYGASKASPEHLGRIWTAELAGTGVGFVNVRGEAIMYYLEEKDTDPVSGKPRPQALERVNLATKKSEKVLPSLRLFRVVVPPFRIGKKIARERCE